MADKGNAPKAGDCMKARLATAYRAERSKRRQGTMANRRMPTTPISTGLARLLMLKPIKRSSRTPKGAPRQARCQANDLAVKPYYLPGILQAWHLGSFTSLRAPGLPIAAPITLPKNPPILNAELLRTLSHARRQSALLFWSHGYPSRQAP